MGAFEARYAAQSVYMLGYGRILTLRGDGMSFLFFLRGGREL